MKSNGLKNSKNIDFKRGGVMKKNTKASFVVSLICIVLMLSLMIPTGALKALADSNNSADNNASPDTTINNGSDDNLNTTDNKDYSQNSNINTVDAFNNNNFEEKVDNDVNNSSLNQTGITITITSDPESAGGFKDSVNDWISSPFTLPCPFGSVKFSNDGSFQIYGYSESGDTKFEDCWYPTSSDDAKYNFSNMLLDDTIVEKDRSYSLQNDPTIKLQFDSTAENKTVKVDLNGGQLDEAVALPDGWEMKDGKPTKSYPTGTTTYGSIQEEWKDVFEHITKDKAMLDKENPFGDDFDPTQTVQNDVTFTLNWIDLITVTADLDGGKCDDYPDGWTYDGDLNIYSKKFPVNTYDQSAAEEWNNSTITKENKKFIGFLEPGSYKPMTQDTEFKAKYKDTAFPVTFKLQDFHTADLQECSANYLEMKVNEETVTGDEYTFQNIPDGTEWSIKESVGSKYYSVRVILGDIYSENYDTVEITVKDKYKDVLEPSFYCEDSLETEGTITESTTFYGEASPIDSYSIDFSFTNDSFDMGYIYDSAHDQSRTNAFPYYFPGAVTVDYKVDADNERIITLDPSTPFEDESYSFTLYPDTTKEVDSGYWILNGIRLNPGDTGTISGQSDLKANFYKQASLLTIKGQVKDSVSYDGIEDASLELFDNDGNIVGQTQTDKYGNYNFSAPGSDMYRVYCTYSNSQATYHDYVSDKFILQDDEYVLDINLEAVDPDETVEFCGVVVAPSGDKLYEVCNALVKFTCSSANSTFSTYTNNKGQFSMRIPKNQPGSYVVDSQGRFDEHRFYFDGASAEGEGFVGSVLVYDETQWANLTVSVDEQSSDYGLIEEDFNGDVDQSKSFAIDLGIAGNDNVYPTYIVNDDDTITVKSIYLEEYTFTPKRFGACAFEGWNAMSQKSGEIKTDITFSAFFDELTPENDFSLDGNNEGFLNYGYSYINSDGADYNTEITEEEQYFANDVYSGSIVMLTEPNQIAIAYTDEGEVKGFEYTEVAVIDVNCKDSYEVDNINLNGQQLIVNEPIIVSEDTNFTINYKASSTPEPTPTPIDDPTSDSASSSTASSSYSSSNSATTSDYTIYAIFALSLIVSCGVSTLCLRRRFDR